MTIVNPSEAKTVSTILTVPRSFIEMLVLTLEPETMTWRMDNETLLAVLHGNIIQKS